MSSLSRFSFINLATFNLDEHPIIDLFMLSGSVKDEIKTVTHLLELQNVKLVNVAQNNRVNQTATLFNILKDEVCA